MNRILAVLFIFASISYSYPEFQQFSQKHSKRTVNCGMCHSSAEGPDGMSFGQIGSLDSLQMEKVKEARRAQKPGMDVDNPLLNSFGNKLVSVMGVRLLVDAKKDPAVIYFYMKEAGDLDGDGIIDAVEFLDGTNPTNKHHGDPWKLFVRNVQKNIFEIVMILLATVFGIYGLSNILMGFAAGPKK